MPATLPDLYKVVEGAAQEEEERGTLADMLDEAFAAICRTVELADGRDLSERSRVVAGVLRLPFHPVILREAKGRGKAAQSSRPSARAASPSPLTPEAPRRRWNAGRILCSTALCS